MLAAAFHHAKHFVMHTLYADTTIMLNINKDAPHIASIALSAPYVKEIRE